LTQGYGILIKSSEGKPGSQTGPGGVGNRLKEFALTTGGVQNRDRPVGGRVIRQVGNDLPRKVSGQQRRGVVDAIRFSSH
jgi:hypothetical protein